MRRDNREIEYIPIRIPIALFRSLEEEAVSRKQDAVNLLIDAWVSFLSNNYYCQMKTNSYLQKNRKNGD